MGKKALIVISFGTTYKNAQMAIENIENKFKNNMPEYDFYRAFTSRMVINKILRTEGTKILNPVEVMEKLYDEGYEEVVCQSLHVINGSEYFKTLKDLQSFSSKFRSIKFGQPLLTSKDDYEICSHIIMNRVPKLQKDEALILMGHGSEHFSNASYCQLDMTFKDLGYQNIYVGTVEGFPDFNYVIECIKKDNIKKVYLMPFMIVAGDHAQNDLAGNDDDSWKSILEKYKYKTEIILNGLGEFDEIGELFFKHIQDARQI
jgi:sirohydrochlorin cobaltochelatase